MSLHDPNLAQQFCDHVLFFYPDGETKHGLSKTILTSEYLTHLYHPPMKKFIQNQAFYWYPDIK